MKKKQMITWMMCCSLALLAGCSRVKSPAAGETQQSSAYAGETAAGGSAADESAAAESATAENTAAGTAAESVAGENTAASTTSTSVIPESNAAEQAAVPAELPDVFPMELIFSSGAGAWRTTLTLNRDGSFSGSFRDSDMGDRTDDYTNGTVYICDFSGQFGDIKQLDSCTYSMELEELTAQKTKAGEWIEDGYRYIAADPYGMEEGKEFLFYTPETELEGLSKEFLSWWPGWYYAHALGKDPVTLSGYGLYNREMGYGFFTYDMD